MELLKSWAITTVREAIEIIDYRGRTPPFSGDGIPHLRSSNIKNGKVVWEDLRYVSEETYQAFMTRGLPQVGDVLFTTEAPLGEVALAPKERFSLAQRMMILRPNRNLLESSFLLYQIKNEEFQSKLKTTGTGSTVTGVSSRNFQPLELIIAPLNEQQRIVTKIEELRERSQKAREALTAIPELCDKFRQSVLAAAFRGDLTADWLEQNPDVEPASVLLERISNETGRGYKEVEGRELPETWKWASFQNVAEIRSNLLDPAGYPDSPHIAPNHIVSGTGELLEFTTVSADKVTSPKHLFEPGQIIYSKIRPYLAKAVLIHFSGLCSADMYPITALIDSAFLHQWMICPEFTELASGQQGRTVLPKINQAALNQLPVPVPPLQEQVEIIKRIHSYLSLITRLTGRIEAETYKMNFLDRSILAKAFRGELVEQDPNDEPAAVLLERIRAEREQQAQGKPQKTGKKGGRATNPD